MNVSIHIIFVSWALKTSYPPRSFIRATHLIKVSELFAEVIAANNNNLCVNDVGSDKADCCHAKLKKRLVALSPSPT